MKIQNAIWATFAIGTILVPAGLAAEGASRDHRKHAVELIGQVEEATREIYFHADRLTTLQRQTTIAPQSHAQHLNAMRELVNTQLKPAIVDLDNMSAVLPEWKQDGIESMIGSAKKLAAETNSAIKTHSDYSLPFYLDEEYKSAIRAVADHAQDLIRVSDATGKLAVAHLQAEKAGLNVALQAGEN